MFLLDLNVWLALATITHEHHDAASRWLQEVSSDDAVAFCRVSQLGFLRLLTTEAIMKSEVKTQQQAWVIYSLLLDDPRVILIDEPPTLERAFRRISARPIVAPKKWNDDYLISFAEAAGMTLVTFDKAAAKAATQSVLLP